MPQFKVEVQLTKYDTYTVTVEANDSSEAESSAFAAWRENVSDFFCVDKPDVYEVVDCTQLTFACDECRAVIDEETAKAHEGLCPACDRRLRDEEIDYWNATPQRIRSAAQQALRVAVIKGREVFDPVTHNRWEAA